MRCRSFCATALALAYAICTIVRAQVVVPLDFSHPAIGYNTSPTTDVAAMLGRKLQQGEARLAFEAGTGYLRSLLAALDIPIESQIVAFSKTSLQSARITPANPRAIYFNDSVAVGWVSGGFIEVAAHDARQGAAFYILQQASSPTPVLSRDDKCLQCHYSVGATHGVPGFLSRSIPTASDGSLMPWLGNVDPDHRTPLEERWGGWFVTGRGTAKHLGNAPLEDRRAQALPASARGVWLPDITSRAETRFLLSAHSDAAALLVFNHQLRMLNLLTRLGWEARIAAHEGTVDAARLRSTVDEVVDYMLFVDEAPIGGVTGSSRFATTFAARGRRDSKGRSLRDLDLGSRLLRYPCSYLIHSDAFDALPPVAKDAVYQRMWDVLRGQERGAKYARLTANDRRAILEILRETKPGLPSYFF